MTLTALSLFSGAGGGDLGLEAAGIKTVALCEIEPHARAVLRHHWPDVPLHDDVTTLDGTPYVGVDLVVGGSPCQDLSIAGKRAGMTEGSGTRSSLFFEQIRIWQETQSPYILWENVVGALSSNTGRDFAAVLSAIVGAAVPVPSDGWESAGVAAGPTGVAAWRILDAQYFGVPQRRRRVFVLGARAGGINPAQVLLDGDGLCGNPAPSGETWEGVAADAGRGAPGGGGRPTVVLPASAVNISNSAALTYDARGNGDGDVVNTLAGDHANRVTDYTPLVVNQQHDASGSQAVFTKRQYGSYEDAPRVASTLGARDHASLNVDLAVGAVGRPRRLMPVECERLMGWPDQHTAIGIDEKGREYALADTPRYKLCGNGIASPVIQWIGERLCRMIDKRQSPV